MMSLPFILPSVTTHGPIPQWEGNQFRIGNEVTSVLEYSVNQLGWNDELTFFHEESAGDQHFIDRASRDHAIAQLKKHLHCTNPVLLEIGCSSGYMLKRMHKDFPSATLMGSDIVTDPLQKLSATLPHIPLFRFDLTQCPLPDNSIDGIVILNVLEHIENDSLALQQIHRILKPGGMAVIEVPAGPHLYDIYDKVLMHYRRYSARELRQLVRKTGFRITQQSHLGFFLYPGFWWVKQRNKRFLSEPLTAQQERIKNTIQSTGENKLFHAVMQSELFLGKWVRYPTGIRCLISCIKSK